LTLKKFADTALVFILLAGLAAALCCGCGNGAPDAGAARERDEVKIQTEEGEDTVSRGVTEEEIGVPIFPGAKMVEEEASTTRNEEGDVTWSGVVMLTDTPFAQVSEWYRDRLSGRPGFEDMTSSLEDEQMAIFVFETGDDVKMVTICAGGTEYLAKTVISIGSGSGSDIKSE
jgi:hypothetical protein